MKPKSFNRDMKRELAGTLAAHGVAAVIACAAAAGAWDYARWWTLSLISGLSVLLRLPTADPGPEPTYVFRGPLEAAADAAASGQAGELLWRRSPSSRPPSSRSDSFLGAVHG